MTNTDLKLQRNHRIRSAEDRDPAALADVVLASCGLSSVLDIGSGNGLLVSALLRRDIDARGLDIDVTKVERANTFMPGRFVHGDVRAMPFADGEFDVVVSNGCLEWLDEADVVSALIEMRRVSRRFVVLDLDVSMVEGDPQRSWGRSRAWWERMCFAAGFRKHPRYYRINAYEALNHDGDRVVVAMERIPDAALKSYPLTSLEEERGLHMDMLRDTGERSDAHVIRYQWACQFIRPGDRVLDAACGLGYGGHVVRSLTRASSVIGMDGSEYAVDYANRCYAEDQGRGSYVCGFLPEALSGYPDASFDVVISFETLEHVEDPKGLLKEFHRLLTPGGRVIVSVPNDWSDESGEDPNPYHLQVYDLDRLRSEVASDFDVEAVYVQSASQAKVVGQRFVWERKQRELYPVDPATRHEHSAEWWLMVGMKSPFVEAEYKERVFRNVFASGHPSVRYAQEYANPWLGLSMITIGQRASLPALRDKYATQVLDESAPESADYGAALCVKAYSLLECDLPDASLMNALVIEIDRYLSASDRKGMILRWCVSLAYVKADILRRQGKLEGALEAFVACANIDAAGFGIHLLTKTASSWYEAGRLALAMGRRDQAREFWSSGLSVGKTLLSTKVESVVLNLEQPNLFNHGDGIREYTLAWDYLARCANGLHLLASANDVDPAALDASFAAEYQIVTRDLHGTREQLRERDRELVALRTQLQDRTLRLETATADLVHRTNELVDVRNTLIERTRALEDLSELLRQRTDLLEASNELLAAQQAELEDLRDLLAVRTAALDVASLDLQDRTRRLEAACAQVEQSDKDLKNLRSMLTERDNALRLAAGDLVDRTDRLETAETELVGRTGRLETAETELVGRTDRLETAEAELVDRTERLETALAELAETYRTLDQTRQTLIERTQMLEQLTVELEDRTRRLEKALGSDAAGGSAY